MRENRSAAWRRSDLSLQEPCAGGCLLAAIRNPAVARASLLPAQETSEAVAAPLRTILPGEDERGAPFRRTETPGGQRNINPQAQSRVLTYNIGLYLYSVL